MRRPAAFITDPIEVGAYDHRFAKLEHAAVFGDEARTVFTPGRRRVPGARGTHSRHGRPDQVPLTAADEAWLCL